MPMPRCPRRCNAMLSSLLPPPCCRVESVLVLAVPRRVHGVLGAYAGAAGDADDERLVERARGDERVRAQVLHGLDARFEARCRKADVLGADAGDAAVAVQLQ